MSRSVAELLRSLEASGHSVALDDAGRIIIRPALPQETADALRARKREIAEELRRRNAEAHAAEWRVDCSAFVTFADANERAACLSCGGSWELHGSPARERWRTVALDEPVAPHVARFVVVKRAEAIAKARG